MKKLFPMMLVMMLLLTLSANAMGISIKGVRTTPQLSISGTTATCRVTIREPNCQINVTMELWQGSSLLRTWTSSGKSLVKLDGSYAKLQHGETYTLKAYGTIDGVAFSAAPNSKTA